MSRLEKLMIPCLSGLMMIACASPAGKARVDPFPLRLPLAEAGTFDIDGHIAGQPRVRDGILHYVTSEGYSTELVVATRTVLRRHKDADPTAEAVSLDTRIAAGKRVYFGSADRMFYCLDASTGKVKWKRKLQGALLHPPSSLAAASRSSPRTAPYTSFPPEEDRSSPGQPFPPGSSSSRPVPVSFSLSLRPPTASSSSIFGRESG